MEEPDLNMENTKIQLHFLAYFHVLEYAFCDFQ